jgi:hypothetical protein
VAEIVPHGYIANTIVLRLRDNGSGSFLFGKKVLMLNPDLGKGGF